MGGGFGWGVVRFEGFLGDEMMVRRGVGCVCYRRKDEKASSFESHFPYNHAIPHPT